MPQGGLLTTAWPRASAHALILVSVAAIWLVPHASVGAQASTRAVSVPVAITTVPPPLQAMAERPRTVSALPISGTAFEQIPVPASPRPGVKVSAARRSVVTPRAAHITPPPPPPAPSAGWGNDISWPQCDGAYPGGHDVGVVGVTNGRPFTTNPCLGSEWGWAQASAKAGGAQTYINLELAGTSDGPHHCAADNHNCRAYDYGWVSVTDAMGRAAQSGVSSPFWWLDVEVGNAWSDDLSLNSATVQGAIDAARNHGLDVGIYSSADQWAEIVPPDYRPGVPTWLAVVGNSGMAPGLCAPQFSLTGGRVYLVQFDDHTFDSDHVCAAGAAAFAVAAARHGH